MRDIRQTTDGDLDIVNGDISYTESTSQHQRDILLAGDGEYKLAPTATVGIANYLLDDAADDLLAKSRRKLTGDGMTVRRLAIVNGKLQIDAGYND